MNKIKELERLQKDMYKNIIEGRHILHKMERMPLIPMTRLFNALNMYNNIVHDYNKLTLRIQEMRELEGEMILNSVIV